MGSILNTSERIFSTFDEIFHQTFRAARFNVLRIAESDSDDEEEIQEHTTEKLDRPDPNTKDNTEQWKRCCFHKFIMSSCYGKDVTEMLSLVARIRAFNINEPIYVTLCHEFYSTYKFDEVCADDELQSRKIIKFRLGGRAYSLTLSEFTHRLGLYQALELEEDGYNVYFKGG
nr:hypothetical protein [Tanacetum cinerariifolium]